MSKQKLTPNGRKYFYTPSQMSKHCRHAKTVGKAASGLLTALKNAQIPADKQLLVLGGSDNEAHLDFVYNWIKNSEKAIDKFLQERGE